MNPSLFMSDFDLRMIGWGCVQFTIDFSSDNSSRSDSGDVTIYYCMLFSVSIEK